MFMDKVLCVHGSVPASCGVESRKGIYLRDKTTQATWRRRGGRSSNLDTARTYAKYAGVSLVQHEQLAPD